MYIYGLNLETYILLFFIYAILGWVMEIINNIIRTKKFVNRGFLIGPYCPIYGYGSLLITLFLQKFDHDPFVLFIMAIFICGALEYSTSFLMEKIYHARWWDYSNKKFNLNGRICLETLIPFGLAGVFIIYIANPFFENIIRSISPNIKTIITITLLSIFAIDSIISGIVIKYIRKANRKASRNHDSTEEITQEVKSILFNKSLLHRRLVLAYPKLESIKTKIKEQTKKIKEKQEEIIQNISQKNEDIKENIKNSFNDLKDKTNQIVTEKIITKNDYTNKTNANKESKKNKSED